MRFASAFFILLLTLLGSAGRASSLPAVGRGELCRDLFETRAPLNADIKRLEVKLDQRQDIQSDVSTLESAIESYLQEQNISYRLMPAKNEGRLAGLNSHGFVLSGNAKVGGNSGLIANAQNFRDPRDNAQFVLDSLYRLREKSAAHYQMNGQILFFGPEALEFQELRLRNYLGHELRHHLEQLKVNHGDFSLGRFIYTNPSGKHDEAYDDILHFDELEAYGEDAAFYAKDPIQLETTNRILKPLIVKERALLEKLKAKLQAGFFTVNETQQLMLASFVKPIPMNYAVQFELEAGTSLTVQLSFKNQLPDRPSRNDLSFLLNETITTAESRINEIENSLSSSSPKTQKKRGSRKATPKSNPKQNSPD